MDTGVVLVLLEPTFRTLVPFQFVPLPEMQLVFPLLDTSQVLVLFLPVLLVGGSVFDAPAAESPFEARLSIFVDWTNTSKHILHGRAVSTVSMRGNGDFDGNGCRESEQMLARENKGNLVHDVQSVEDVDDELIGQGEKWRRNGKWRIVQLISMSFRFEEKLAVLTGSGMARDFQASCLRL